MIHPSVEEPAALLRNFSEDSFVQRFYKNTSNITGSYSYWFHKRRKLTAQANHEGLQGILFFAFSSAANHCKPLVRLLDVSGISNIQVWCSDFHKNPYIVAWYFSDAWSVRNALF